MSGIDREAARAEPTDSTASAPDMPETSRTARLEESAALFEALYEAAPVGLCLVDRDLRYLRANEEYAQIVGRSPAELIGFTMGEVIPASARHGAVEAAARVVETGEPVLGLELRREDPDDPDGDRIWLVNIRPVRREGRVTGATAVLQNITEVRRAEEEARARLSELESIYRNAPVGLSFIDHDLRYVRVNQVIADMNGVSIEEMLGKTYRDMAPLTADAAEPFLRGLMESGESVRNLETVSPLPTNPDVDRHFLLSMDPARNEQGEIIGHTAVVQDVTEQRRAEEIAAARLGELEILYANTPVGLCHTDTDLRIIHLNPFFQQLSVLPSDQLVGARFGEVFSEQIERQLVPQLEYVLRSGASSTNLRIRGTMPGSPREHVWIANTHPTRRRDGAVTGLTTVLQDATAPYERQREAEEMAERLDEGQRMTHVGGFDWNLIDDEVWWSSEMYTITGRPRSFVPSYVKILEFVHADDREKLRTQLDRTVADGNTARASFRILRPDGSERAIFGLARIDRMEGGLPARMVGTWQDVTEFADLPPAKRRKKPER